MLLGNCAGRLFLFMVITPCPIHWDEVVKVLVGYTVTLQERVKLLYGVMSRTVVGVAITEEPAWLGGGEETSLVILLH